MNHEDRFMTQAWAKQPVPVIHYPHQWRVNIK